MSRERKKISFDFPAKLTAEISAPMKNEVDYVITLRKAEKFPEF